MWVALRGLDTQVTPQPSTHLQQAPHEPVHGDSGAEKFAGPLSAAVESAEAMDEVSLGLLDDPAVHVEGALGHVVPAVHRGHGLVELCQWWRMTCSEVEWKETNESRAG